MGNVVTFIMVDHYRKTVFLKRHIFSSLFHLCLEGGRPCPTTPTRHNYVRQKLFSPSDMDYMDRQCSIYCTKPQRREWCDDDDDGDDDDEALSNSSTCL